MAAVNFHGHKHCHGNYQNRLNLPINSLNASVSRASTRMNPVYRKTRFLLSAPELRHLPTDAGHEVAFAGRSNAGKSSAINAITGQKALARTSKTPGRTQRLNVFPVVNDRYLIDLPGYGFAKQPQAIRRHWQRTLPQYLQRRQSLRGLMLIMDIRHPRTELDQQMLAWCVQASLPVHVLLTKADKLKKGPAINTVRCTQEWLTEDHPEASVQLFSASRYQGLDTAHSKLDAWLDLGAGPQGASDLAIDNRAGDYTAAPFTVDPSWK